MKTSRLIASLAMIMILTALSTAKLNAQTCDPVTAPQLRSIATQLGYTINDITTTVGSEKFSVTINKGGLDIPIALEISPSKKYVWLTVNLGTAKADTSVRHHALLKQNSVIQPCQFYISGSGLLMMGLPLENSGITNAFLREKLELVAKNVSNSETIWK